MGREEKVFKETYSSVYLKKKNQYSPKKKTKKTKKNKSKA